MVDNGLREFVEWRRTFAPDAKSLGKGFNDPIFFDEWYCRDFLRAVPELVRRTRALAELALPKSADMEALVYLRESASCLVFGLSQAAVALARAAVEACSREVYAKVPGNTAHALQDTTLDPLISNLSTLFNRSKGRARLSAEAERWARCDEGGAACPAGSRETPGWPGPLTEQEQAALENLAQRMGKTPDELVHDAEVDLPKPPLPDPDVRLRPGFSTMGEPYSRLL